MQASLGVTETECRRWRNKGNNSRQAQKCHHPPPPPQKKNQTTHSGASVQFMSGWKDTERVRILILFLILFQVTRFWYNPNHQTKFLLLWGISLKAWRNTWIFQKKSKHANKLMGFKRCLKAFYDLKTKLTLESKIQDRKHNPKRHKTDKNNNTGQTQSSYNCRQTLVYEVSL